MCPLPELMGAALAETKGSGIGVTRMCGLLLVTVTQQLDGVGIRSDARNFRLHALRPIATRCQVISGRGFPAAGFFQADGGQGPVQRGPLDCNGAIHRHGLTDKVRCVRCLLFPGTSTHPPVSHPPPRPRSPTRSRPRGDLASLGPDSERQQVFPAIPGSCQRQRPFAEPRVETILGSWLVAPRTCYS